MLPDAAAALRLVRPTLCGGRVHDVLLLLVDVSFKIIAATRVNTSTKRKRVDRRIFHPRRLVLRRDPLVANATPTIFRKRWFEWPAGYGNIIAATRDNR